jgi:hypothetical protein
MIPLILTCAVFIVIDATAFSTTPHLSARMRSSPSLMPLGSETAKIVAADVVADEIDNDVTCYVVNDVEVVTEGQKPHVVCTSEPEG